MTYKPSFAFADAAQGLRDLARMFRKDIEQSVVAAKLWQLVPDLEKDETNSHVIPALLKVREHDLLMLSGEAAAVECVEAKTLERVH